MLALKGMSKKNKPEQWLQNIKTALKASPQEKGKPEQWLQRKIPPYSLEACLVKPSTLGKAKNVSLEGYV